MILASSVFSINNPIPNAALDFVSASSSVRRCDKILYSRSVDGVTAEPIPRIHSPSTPTDVERSIERLLLANLKIGFSKILKSCAKDGPRATARPMIQSRAVSMTSQSYSADSSGMESSEGEEASCM